MQLNLNAHYFQALASFTTSPADGMGRGYLRGVYCVAHARGGAVLVATDGHRLGAFYDRDGVAGPEGAIIRAPRQMLSHMKKAAVGRPEDERVAFYVDAPDCLASAPTLGNGHKLARSECAGLTTDAEIIDRKYCDWRRMVDRADPERLTCGPVGFNARYMADFANCSAAWHLPPKKDRANALTFLPTDGESAVLVLTSCPDFIGVLMPMRSRARRDAPEAEWFRTQDTPPESIAAE